MDNVVNFNVNNNNSNKRSVQEDDMTVVMEFTDWLSQFSPEGILGLMCLQFDILDNNLDEFDSVEMSGVVANTIKSVHSALDRR